jgi:hypothetical protein
MTPGFRYSSGIGTAGVTCAMDSAGAYSPIDRRMYPIFAVRDLAVSQSWLVLSSWQPDKDRLPVFYRIDAADATEVHEIFPSTAAVYIKTLGRPKLFPPRGKNFSRGSWRGKLPAPWNAVTPCFGQA